MNASDVFNFDIPVAKYIIEGEEFELRSPSVGLVKKAGNIFQKIEELESGKKKKGNNVNVTEVVSFLDNIKETDNNFQVLMGIQIDLLKLLLKGNTGIFNEDNFRPDFFRKVIDDFFSVYSGRTNYVK